MTNIKKKEKKKRPTWPHTMVGMTPTRYRGMTLVVVWGWWSTVMLGRGPVVMVVVGRGHPAATVEGGRHGPR